MNTIILSGRTANDIEIKYGQTGTAIAGFALAVDDGWGEKKKTYFIPCKCFGKTAETVGNYVGKGQKILINGRLSIDKWETSDGQKRSKAEVLVDHVEFLEPKRKDTEIVIPGQEEKADAAQTFGKEIFPGEEIPF